MRVVVYTAIVGDGDTLRPPLCEQPADISFVCFTDRKFPDPGPWDVRPVSHFVRDPRRTARWHKINSHLLFPQYDVSVWVDGSLQLRVAADKLAAQALAGHNVLAAFKHPERDCTYAEHLACRRLRKDDPLVMQRQMDHYKFLGYPPHNGLAETGCVVRTPAAADFEREWWATLDRFSHRDQLSFDFAAWRLKLGYGHLPGSARKSPAFVYHPHRRAKK